MRSHFLVVPTLSSLVLVFSASLSTGCSNKSCVDAAGPRDTPEYLGAEPGGIHGFATEGELSDYLASIESQQPKSAGCDDETSKSNFASADSAAAPAAGNETITNNQEAGVDEGGIVKNVGSQLVVLRQGRLFAVDVTDGRAPSLTDSIRVARTETLNNDVWYDEMLVKGDLIYVVGYRYDTPSTSGASVRGATEVDSFRLTNGKLTRLKSMFLESNDYYSFHDYASRMVGGKLVFYMPHYIRRSYGEVVYPRQLEANDAGEFSVVGPIFGALDVKTSLQKPLYPTFHTIVQCELPETGEFSCHGRSVIGSWWRERYVSPSAVYLWAGSHVYRFAFDSLGIGVHGAKGGTLPRDQFSFKETDTSLVVAVQAGGDTPSAEVLSMPLAAFDGVGAQTAASTALGGGYLGKNRFVGNVLVASLDNWDGGSDSASSELFSYDSETGVLARVPADASVVRIEPLGERRVLVVRGDRVFSSAARLEFGVLSVDAPQAKLGTLVLQGVNEGEGRSHGFFYKPGIDGAGTFGYSVIAPPGYGAPHGWGNGISNLGFFDVGGTGGIAQLGIVSAGAGETQCETSCIDWYGNTRPVFLGSRVFALMGSELAEVALHHGAQKVGAPVALTFAP